MKVFVSSTVYDLLDIRSELAVYLRELGAVPVLSDDKLSGFEVSPSANSIETCLINVRQADRFLIILDQRYGPSLKTAGFEDVSATHLEYREAIKAGVPVDFFVRDHLLADHAIWKRDKTSRLAWVKEERDRALFGLMDEHFHLAADATHSNWRHVFSNSVDLKAGVGQILRKPLLEKKLVDAIHANQFPLFIGHTRVSNKASTIEAHVSFENVSKASAFNVTVDRNNEQLNQRLVPPGVSVRLSAIEQSNWGFDFGAEIALRYETALGVTVHETWTASFIFQGLNVLNYVSLKSRRFFVGDVPVIQLEG